MSNLIKSDSKLNLAIPIKAIPEQELNRIILTDFLTWLSGILSLTDEVSANRLEIALPALKEHCWSMGFQEITKMFQMYVDNKLSIEPIPNYFDRILFGKIVSAYKEQKPRIKKEIKMPEISEEEKQRLIIHGVINCFDEYLQSKRIIDGYVWVYDHLDEIKLISYTPEEKKKQMPIAKERVLNEAKDSFDRNKYAELIFKFENTTNHQIIINEAKKMLLERYFAKLQAKSQHIKDLL